MQNNAQGIVIQCNIMQYNTDEIDTIVYSSLTILNNNKKIHEVFHVLESVACSFEEEHLCGYTYTPGYNQWGRQVDSEGRMFITLFTVPYYV